MVDLRPVVVAGGVQAVCDGSVELEVEFELDDDHALEVVLDATGGVDGVDQFDGVDAHVGAGAASGQEQDQGGEKEQEFGFHGLVLLGFSKNLNSNDVSMMRAMFLPVENPPHLGLPGGRGLAGILLLI